jgi:ubiquinone/menaquinone biosynthesis C-methylase UbiE
VLDIGCGCGHTLETFHNHKPELCLHGVDMSEKIIEQAQKTHSWGTFLVAKAERLPYPSQSMVAVVSCNSMHHYDKPLQVFEEVSRVLLPGGTFYVNDFSQNGGHSGFLTGMVAVQHTTLRNFIEKKKSES